MTSWIVLIFAVIIAAFTLLAMITKKEEVCAKGMTGEMKRMFYHGGVAHAYSNLFVFAQLTTVLQPALGTAGYLTLVLVIMAINAIINFFLYQNDLVNCGIGFSGVVFGLFTWNLLFNNGFNLQSLIDLIILLAPSFYDRRLSLSGHAIGILSGLLTAPIIALVR